MTKLHKPRLASITVLRTPLQVHPRRPSLKPFDCVTGTPVRATEAEEVMIGIAPVDEEAIGAAAEKIPAALTGALADTYASSEYRVHLAQVLAKRAIKAALAAA